MHSKTKVSLRQADIERVVRHAFGAVNIADLRELKDGYFNTAYHMTFSDSRQTVFKVGPPADADILAYEKNILRAEVDAMKLAATNPAIPVPRIQFDDFSRVHLPYDYYFMDFVAGDTWNKVRDNLTPQQNQRIITELGRITAQINAFERQTFGYFAHGRHFDTWPKAFRWMCELLFADARRYDIALPLSETEFFQHFEAHRAVFEEVTRAQLVHWDLWAGNVFVVTEHDTGDDTAHISGVVDFERVLWGDPLMEEYLSHFKDIGVYNAGYAEVAGDGVAFLSTKSQRLRRIFYNVYLYLVMIVEDGPRQYTDKWTVQWATGRLADNLVMLRHGDIIES